MQLIEFDPKNFIVAILVFLGGCFSVGQSNVTEIREPEITTTKMDKSYPDLTITADKTHVINFLLTVTKDSAVSFTAKNNNNDIKRTIDKLLSDVRERETIPVLIKVSDNMDAASFKYLLTELTKRGVKKINTVGQTDN